MCSTYASIAGYCDSECCSQNATKNEEFPATSCKTGHKKGPLW